MRKSPSFILQDKIITQHPCLGLYCHQSLLPPPMDRTAAGNAAMAGRTVGGRPVNIAGRWGNRPKKPSFVRDARLAQDGAWLMTGPFCLPGEPSVFCPAAAHAAAAAAMSPAAALASAGRSAASASTRTSTAVASAAMSTALTLAGRSTASASARTFSFTVSAAMSTAAATSAAAALNLTTGNNNCSDKATLWLLNNCLSQQGIRASPPSSVFWGISGASCRID